MGELGRRFQRHMVLRFKPHSGDDPPRRGRGAPKRLARWRLRSPLRSTSFYPLRRRCLCATLSPSSIAWFFRRARDKTLIVVPINDDYPVMV